MNELIHFVESAVGFELNDKLKLILFSLSCKKACYCQLRISADNLDEKHHFEKHLKLLGFPFIVSKPKPYEEIVKVKKHWLVMDIKGIWYGYDVFQDDGAKRAFLRYKQLLKKGRISLADRIGGGLYGYPVCCTKAFIHGKAVFSPKTAFVVHGLCSVNCPASKKQNQKNISLIRKNAPGFYREFSKHLVVNAEVVVVEKLPENDYVACLKRINGKYVLFPLDVRLYPVGTVLKGVLRTRYNHASFRPERAFLRRILITRHLRGRI
ncbi:hypothetical protein HY486_00685 [Candidatus Woesearchaeota archaeon]|nr:hypothetical protein [Candidatus Woesearchaeota archaeon]